MALDAVVLAGGEHDAIAALEPGAPNKTFVRVGGVPLVARTIAGLRASSRVDRIVVVAPVAAAAHPALAGASEVRPDGARMIESLRSGLSGFTEEALVLVAAGDLPALDGDAVDEFADAVLERRLDIAYACVERRHHDAVYPEFPHTWARMRDGQYCGGGIVALRPRALPCLAGLLDGLGRARKSPLRLASLFGWSTLARFALGRLSVEDAEARACAILGDGVRVGAVRCRLPQIALNVDRVDDVERATRRFGEPMASSGR